MVALMKARTPKMTLAQKIARHDQPKTKRPPMSGPRASPRLDTAAQIPSERARWARSGYRCLIIDRVPGSEAAAPTPMTTRPAMRTSVVGAMAAITEPAQNTATPNRITFLRPSRSPMVPKLNIRLAKVRAYPFTTHCSWLTEACRALCTFDNTTVTMVLSRNVRKRTNSSVARANDVDRDVRPLPPDPVGPAAAAVVPASIYGWSSNSDANR
jgi:hypothetical protein